MQTSKKNETEKQLYSTIISHENRAAERDQERFEERAGITTDSSQRVAAPKSPLVSHSLCAEAFPEVPLTDLSYYFFCNT